MKQHGLRIGLEVHVRLNTQSRLFSNSCHPCKGLAPNAGCTHYDLAMPGTLPVLNAEALKQALRFALACEASISPVLAFDRKHYSYPDLPKGYQITQQRMPLMRQGKLPYINRKGQTVHVPISHAHLEEDTAQLTYQDDGTVMIDYNRASAPLLEIVTPPCFHDADAVIAWLKSLRQCLIDLNISHARMHRAELRCDINLSLCDPTNQACTPRMEIKNMNSLHAIKRAITYETKRLHQALTHGATLQAESRHYHARTKQTVFARFKEATADYAYLPEANLPPSAMPLGALPALKKTLPVPHWQRQSQLQTHYGLTAVCAAWLSCQPEQHTLFEACCKQLQHASPQMLAHFMMNELHALLKKTTQPVMQTQLNARNIASLLDAVALKRISKQDAVSLLNDPAHHPEPLKPLRLQKSLTPEVNTGKLEQLITQVFKKSPHLLQAYTQGKTQVIHHLMHNLKQADEGINPTTAYAVLEQALKQHTSQQHD
jgi:aspartyl-tRNA(Asn)/glutamyl-tRNA(Gln) amidotransferase subunit B